MDAENRCLSGKKRDRKTEREREKNKWDSLRAAKIL